MNNLKNKKGLESIGEIIPAALKKIDVGRNMSKYKVIVNWDKIVGKEIADNSFVSNIDRGKLIIKVKNSVWSHHLMMLKEKMIKKINGYLGENLINDIWFMAGYDRDKQNYKSNEPSIGKDENPIRPMRLNESEMNAAELIAEKISDNNIRERFIRLIIKNMALEKAKKSNNWKLCLKCDVFVPPEKEYCTVCQINKNNRNDEKNTINSIEKMLLEAPWLSYSEIKSCIAVSLEEYNSAKKNLVRYYVKKIFSEEGDKIFKADLVMLLKEIKPEDLNQVCIDDVIGEVEKRLFKKKGGEYVSTSGS